MKSFLKIKSVNSGMITLLDDYCKKYNLNCSTNIQYTLNDQIVFDKWLNKIKHIKEQNQQEGLGLDIGALFQPNHMGILAYLTQSSHTLADYINILIKYEKLWLNYTPKTVFSQNDYFSIFWDKPTYLQIGLYLQETAITEEIQVAILYKHLKQNMDLKKNIFHSLELSIPEPKNIEKYLEYFNCPVTFNAKHTKITLPTSLLKIKLKNSDPTLLEMLSKHANTLLKKIPKQDSLREMVNLSIIKALESNDVKINTVADFLNTSPRLLQSDLKKNGLSFRNSLNTIRQNLAKKYLCNYNLMIVDIAFLLGYKDQTSFNRAFKNWTGVSPSKWRKWQKNKNDSSST
ncbi:helix-turn-helix domain-containing protein [Acinetobacter nematophilus]|uniref:AraC family transcriptional regulator n=1 Tax=Acinetobacter nematophilus TaxID=2994642 RepID=UPI003AF74FA6